MQNSTSDKSECEDYEGTDSYTYSYFLNLERTHTPYNPHTLHCWRHCAQTPNKNEWRFETEATGSLSV